jgi:nucleoside-diphosphate-sugar epimerase
MTSPLPCTKTAVLTPVCRFLDSVRLVGKRPNTYTYTKALAEHLLLEECGSIPLAIVRPTIVTAALREPIPGWVDNLNGPTGKSSPLFFLFICPSLI